MKAKKLLLGMEKLKIDWFESFFYPQNRWDFYDEI